MVRWFGLHAASRVLGSDPDRSDRPPRRGRGLLVDPARPFLRLERRPFGLACPALSRGVAVRSDSGCLVDRLGSANLVARVTPTCRGSRSPSFPIPTRAKMTR